MQVIQTTEAFLVVCIQIAINSQALLGMILRKAKLGASVKHPSDNKPDVFKTIGQKHVECI